MIGKKRGFILVLSLILLISAGWKVLLQVWDVVPFNSDEAIVALMARHILQGQHMTWFYGQHYMGSLDAYLIAGGFALFGEQVWVIRLVQGLLYMGTLVTTVLLGREAFGSWKSGLLAAGLLAIPTVNLTLYTSATLGGYGETLLLGNLVLLLTLKLSKRFNWRLMLLWGVFAGLGLWTMDLSLIFSGPAALYLLWALVKKKDSRAIAQALLAGGAGLLIGALPWWVYALRHGVAGLLFDTLVQGGLYEETPFLVRTGMHLVNFLLLGLPAALGLRPTWEVRWLALPLIPLVLGFWVVVLMFAWKQAGKDTPSRPPYWLLWSLVLGLSLAFVLTPFGADPSGRYLLPLSVPLALFSAQFILEMKLPRWLRFAIPAVLIAFHVWGNVDCALRNPPGITPQFDLKAGVDHRYDAELIAFLRSEGELRGYSNYWLAFPLAFKTGEAILYEPRLPYHQDLRYTRVDSRMPAYAEAVQASDKVAFIAGDTPLLIERLRAGLDALEVTYEEKVIGDYHIFYRLSRAVRPEELNLGEASQ